MNHIEGAPFWVSSQKIGDKDSSDSKVALVKPQKLHRSDALRTVQRNMVIKWNRHPIVSEDEAFEVCEFIQRSLELYKTVLGEDVIVPTSLVVGSGNASKNKKCRVYEVQPFVEGVIAKDLSEELRENPLLLSRWRNVYSRLSMLYIVGHNVNASVLLPDLAFPINLTVGATRKKALSGEDTESNFALPRTPNLLITPDNQMALFDFGAYTPWKKAMEPAYNEIFERSQRAVAALSGF